MALLPTGWIKMPGDNDETKRFAWSHVKSIFYNKAANILLKDKLDEMDKIIDEKIAKALMSNVQVNDQSKIPTSALAYAMQQSITKNGQDIAKLNSDFGSLLKPTTETINIDSLNLENGTYVIGTGMSGTKPFEYGILIQFKRYTYTVQIAIDIDSAAIAKRQTNNERWLNWDFYVTKSDLALQTQTLYKNVVIYRIGNIAMLSAPSWVRKEELAGVTIPTGYRPVKTISIPFTQQNFNDGAYCDVSTEGKINYTGTSPIVINAIWFCT